MIFCFSKNQNIFWHLSLAILFKHKCFAWIGLVVSTFTCHKQTSKSIIYLYIYIPFYLWYLYLYDKALRSYIYMCVSYIVSNCWTINYWGNKWVFWGQHEAKTIRFYSKLIFFKNSMGNVGHFRWAEGETQVCNGAMRYSDWTCISKSEKVLFFTRKRSKTLLQRKFFGTLRDRGSMRCIIMEISLFKFLSY